MESTNLYSFDGRFSFDFWNTILLSSCKQTAFLLLCLNMNFQWKLYPLEPISFSHNPPDAFIFLSTKLLAKSEEFGLKL